LAAPPNVVFVLIDDLGYGDLSAYGNPDLQTPNIDAVAEQGTRFTQFYVASPVCSPSRAGFNTGQVPGRSRIHGHFAERAANTAREMPDFLPLAAPSLARQLKAAGYATAHFGKWHLGGGRDVGDAPWPTEYGFDESFTSSEGLGDRVLTEGDDLAEASAALGQGEIVWALQREKTRIYVDKAVDFMTRHQADRFLLHVWLNEVHDPFDPIPELMEKYGEFSANKYVQQYLATIDSMDQELGRLMMAIDNLGLADDTLVVIASDNGPTAWPRYYDEGVAPPGSTDGLRGRKWSLYEGGIRGPLIVRWPGKVPAGKVNDTTVLHAADYLPTIVAIANAALPDSPLDGEDVSDVLFGADRARTSPLFWEYGHFATLMPGLAVDQSPALAVRDGDWKLLMGWDGTGAELYGLQDDRAESENVAPAHPDVVQQLTQELAAWRDSIWVP
jgi:arylsulfatase A-like enzyme